MTITKEDVDAELDRVKKSINKTDDLNQKFFDSIEKKYGIISPDTEFQKRLIYHFGI